MKICSKCKVEKDSDCFSKGKRFKNGLRSTCKDCAKVYRESNKTKIALSKKSHYEINKNDILQYQKDYYQNNRANIIAVQQEYRKSNKPKISLQNSKYYEENKVSIDLRNKEYYKNNKEKIIATQKEYYELHKETIVLYRREYYKNRGQNDLLFKIRRRVSSQVWYYLIKNGSNKNGQSILTFLPYSIRELKEHLEKQFEPWMTWENYGSYVIKDWDDSEQSTWKWQIDHIIPHSQFKYSSMEDQGFRDCWALSNLRPYSAKQNLLDSDRGFNEETSKE